MNFWRFIFCLLTSFLLSNSIQAQSQAELDSLTYSLNALGNDTHRVNRFLDLGIGYYRTNPFNGLAFSAEALALSK
jgi:hypothetical protein